MSEHEDDGAGVAAVIGSAVAITSGVADMSAGSLSSSRPATMPVEFFRIATVDSEKRFWQCRLNTYRLFSQQGLQVEGWEKCTSFDDIVQNLDGNGTVEITVTSGNAVPPVLASNVGATVAPAPAAAAIRSAVAVAGGVPDVPADSLAPSGVAPPPAEFFRIATVDPEKCFQECRPNVYRLLSQQGLSDEDWQRCASFEDLVRDLDGDGSVEFTVPTASVAPDSMAAVSSALSAAVAPSNASTIVAAAAIPAPSLSDVQSGQGGERIGNVIDVESRSTPLLSVDAERRRCCCGRRWRQGILR